MIFLLNNGGSGAAQAVAPSPLMGENAEQCDLFPPDPLSPARMMQRRPRIVLRRVVMAGAVPLIDLGPWFDGTPETRKAVGRQVDAACRDLGFLVIEGHGVDPDLIERMRAVSFAYFDLPEAEKLKLRMPADRYRGYTPLAADNLAASLGAEAPPDLKEAFSIGPVDVPDDAYHRAPAAMNFFAPNMWPDLPGMRETFCAYYRAMEALATELMRIFALGLDLPERYFDDRIDRHITNFSTIHYPAQAEAPKPGQLRAGAHTDYGSLTILQKDSAPGGLQVLGADGRWIDAPDIPGTFTVNLGDLMQDWTAGRWRSTLHRVVNPPAGAGPAGRRLSMPFFHQPNYDAVIEPLPGCTAAPGADFARVTSGEHVLAKISQHRKDDAVLKAGA